MQRPKPKARGSERTAYLPPPIAFGLKPGKTNATVFSEGSGK
jgi:hypothetical protein